MADDLNDLIERINRMGDQGERIKRSALKKSAEYLRDNMKRNAPRSSLNKRHVADNINISDVEKQDGVDIIKIVPGTGFNYWRFSEYGTSKIRAQHWVSKSVLRSKRNIKNIIKDELRRGLNL